MPSTGGRARGNTRLALGSSTARSRVAGPRDYNCSPPQCKYRINKERMRVSLIPKGDRRTALISLCCLYGLPPHCDGPRLLFGCLRGVFRTVIGTDVTYAKCNLSYIFSQRSSFARSAQFAAADARRVEHLPYSCAVQNQVWARTAFFCRLWANRAEVSDEYIGPKKFGPWWTWQPI